MDVLKFLSFSKKEVNKFMREINKNLVSILYWICFIVFFFWGGGLGGET